MTDFYNLSATLPSWKTVSMEQYRGKVVLIVNTASKCGLRWQYSWLEALHNKYKDEWLVVLWFPSNQFANQEPWTDEEIKEQCLINHGVTFQLFKKVILNGEGSDEIFTYLKAQNESFFWTKIKWNFTKFLVSKEGKTVKRFAPIVKPEKMVEDIEKFLK